MAHTPLTIGYGGTLQYLPPPTTPTVAKRLRDWLWEYKHSFVDASTRSGYYLFRAIRLLKDEHGVSAQDIQVSLWGMIDEWHKNEVKSLGLADYIKIEGNFTKKESMDKLDSMDMLFLPLEKGTHGQKTLFIPGKLFEYLQLGKPIFALAEESDCKKIIQGSGLGVIVAPDSVEAIAHQLLELIRNRQMLKTYTPNAAFIEQYTAHNMAVKMAKVFDDLMK